MYDKKVQLLNRKSDIIKCIIEFVVTCTLQIQFYNSLLFSGLCLQGVLAYCHVHCTLYSLFTARYLLYCHVQYITARYLPYCHVQCIHSSVLAVLPCTVYTQLGTCLTAMYSVNTALGTCLTATYSVYTARYLSYCHVQCIHS